MADFTTKGKGVVLGGSASAPVRGGRDLGMIASNDRFGPDLVDGAYLFLAICHACDHGDQCHQMNKHQGLIVP